MKGLIDLASLSSWRDLSVYQCVRLSSQPFLTGIVEKFPRTIHFTIMLYISFLKEIPISFHFAGKMNFVTEHSRPTLLPRSQLYTIIYRSPALGWVSESIQKRRKHHLATAICWVFSRQLYLLTVTRVQIHKRHRGSAQPSDTEENPMFVCETTLLLIAP